MAKIWVYIATICLVFNISSIQLNLILVAGLSPEWPTLKLRLWTSNGRHIVVPKKPQRYCRVKHEIEQ